MSGRPPLNSPEFNVREIAKQLLLLEDHLTDDEKFCVDCIRKHIMMVEALSEESMALDVEGKWLKTSQKLAKKARTWMTNFSDGVDKYVISQDIRMTRKSLVEMVYDPRVFHTRY